MVVFLYPLVDMIGILFDNFQTTIRRLTVYNDILIIGKRLRYHATNGFGQTVLIIQIDCNDR